MSHFLADDRDLEKKAPADDGAETAGADGSEETRLPAEPDASPKPDSDGVEENEEDEEEGENEDDVEEEDEEEEEATEPAGASTESTVDQEQQKPRHET